MVVTASPNNWRSTEPGARAIDVLKVRSARDQDVASCIQIVRGLTDFFTEDVAETVGRDLARHGGWVIVDGDEVIGFTIAERRSLRVAEILWMAVRADRRAAGQGTILLNAVLTKLDDDGVQLVEAKTLDRSAGYAPYESTLAFWDQRGFIQVDTIDPFPGWTPGNPAALYVAALAPTRTRGPQ